jgi:hypothetical protein
MPGELSTDFSTVVHNVPLRGDIRCHPCGQGRKPMGNQPAFGRDSTSRGVGGN